MEYEGLSRDDLNNVRALNALWLQQDGDAELRLSTRRLERLSNAPFLLFSFCEQDETLWERLLNRQPQQDLLEARTEAGTDLQQLQAAGLGFLWELARRNPYVARVVTGAPLLWCEQLAAATLVRLLRCSRYQLIEPRFAVEGLMRRRLLGRGSAAELDIRTFAQIAALHSMLTSGQVAQYGRLPAAACRMPKIARQVADKV